MKLGRGVNLWRTAGLAILHQRLAAAWAVRIPQFRCQVVNHFSIAAGDAIELDHGRVPWVQAQYRSALGW